MILFSSLVELIVILFGIFSWLLASHFTSECELFCFCVYKHEGLLYKSMNVIRYTQHSPCFVFQRVYFQPLEDKMGGKLTIWGGKNINVVGRRTLVKSVITLQAIYHLTPLVVPVGCIASMNKIEHAFLLTGTREVSGGNAYYLTWFCWRVSSYIYYIRFSTKKFQHVILLFGS